MSRWAKISGGLVANVVEQDTMPGIEGTWVECGSAGPGWVYDGETYSAPPEAEDPCKWLLDVGALFDRFNHFTPGTKFAILSHADTGVQAVVKDLQVRKWADLTNPDLADGINLLISKSISGVDADLRDWILATPAGVGENDALRKDYFKETL